MDVDSGERQNTVVHDTINSDKLDSRYLSAVGLPGLVNINNVCYKYNICLQVTGFTAALWHWEIKALLERIDRTAKRQVYYTSNNLSKLIIIIVVGCWA